MIRILPAVLLFSFITWIVIQANRGSTNILFDLVRCVPYGDKMGHFVLYGGLAGLIDIALKHKTISLLGREFLLGSVFVMVLSVCEELTQLCFATRTADLVDLICSLFGVVVFSYFSMRYIEEK